MSRVQRVKKRIVGGLMIATVLSVVGYGSAVAANVISMPLGDPENPNPSPSPGSTYSLVVHMAGSGEGTVISTPRGIHCHAASACHKDFSAGTTVRLQADPSDGATFSGWSGACFGHGDCTLEMNGAHAITASFAVHTEELSVAKVGFGSVTSSRPGIKCGHSCTHEYSHGLAVHLFAHPAHGWHLRNWSGACSKKSCFVQMKSAHRVVAHFSRTHHSHHH
jgi:hypothetical protein